MVIYMVQNRIQNSDTIIKSNNLKFFFPPFFLKKPFPSADVNIIFGSQSNFWSGWLTLLETRPHTISLSNLCRPTDRRAWTLFPIYDLKVQWTTMGTTESVHKISWVLTSTWHKKMKPNLLWLYRIPVHKKVLLTKTKENSRKLWFMWAEAECKVHIFKSGKLDTTRIDFNGKRIWQNYFRLYSDLMHLGYLLKLGTDHTSSHLCFLSVVLLQPNK